MSDMCLQWQFPLGQFFIGLFHFHVHIYAGLHTLFHRGGQTHIHMMLELGECHAHWEFIEAVWTGAGLADRTMCIFESVFGPLKFCGNCSHFWCSYADM